MTSMFVSLPVTDLDRAKAFYAALGFTFNPAMSDHNGACFIVEEDHSYIMVMTREFFQTLTELPLGDPKVSPVSATIVFLDSREAVDATVAAGLAAGGAEPGPATDLGFMYQRPITDPDGNHLEFGWFDPAAEAAGAETA
jgi:predicted lactoylglutathione lyase